MLKRFKKYSSSPSGKKKSSVSEKERIALKYKRRSKTAIESSEPETSVSTPKMVSPPSSAKLDSFYNSFSGSHNNPYYNNPLQPTTGNLSGASANRDPRLKSRDSSIASSGRTNYSSYGVEAKENYVTPALTIPPVPIPPQPQYTSFTPQHIIDYQYRDPRLSVPGDHPVILDTQGMYQRRGQQCEPDLYERRSSSYQPPYDNKKSVVAEKTATTYRDHVKEKENSSKSQIEEDPDKLLKQIASMFGEEKASQIKTIIKDSPVKVPSKDSSEKKSSNKGSSSKSKSSEVKKSSSKSSSSHTKHRSKEHETKRKSEPEKSKVAPKKPKTVEEKPVPEIPVFSFFEGTTNKSKAGEQPKKPPGPKSSKVQAQQPAPVVAEIKSEKEDLEPPKKPSPHKKGKKNELDRLNDDINEMFIRDDVLKLKQRRHPSVTSYNEDELMLDKRVKSCLEKKQPPQQHHHSTVKLPNLRRKIADLNKEYNVHLKPCSVVLERLSDTNQPPPSETNKMKNVQSDIHLQSLFEKQCALCDFSDEDITSHYVTVHPTREVFVSRVNPAVAQQIVLNPHKKHGSIEGSRYNGGMKITCVCPLCQEELSLTGRKWKLHFLQHTGEYKCKGEILFSVHFQNIKSKPQFLNLYIIPFQEFKIPETREKKIPWTNNGRAL